MCAGLQQYQYTGQRGEGGVSAVIKGKVTDLVIDSTGLKVFAEGKWKVRKYCVEKRRVRRKLQPVDPRYRNGGNVVGESP